MPNVHLLTPMMSANGGTEWRTYYMFQLLAEHCNVTIWAMQQPPKELYGKWPMRVVDTKRGLYPLEGTFVFVGVYYDLPKWLSKAAIGRAIFIYNSDTPHHLRAAVEQLRGFGVKEIEVLTASEAMVEHLAGLDVTHVGSERSWIDVDRFKPIETRPERPFTVGRMSRDCRYKFHQDDAAFFRRIASAGYRVRIMGGTCMQREIGECDEIEIISEGAELPEVFLHSIDAMIYRTSNDYFEAYGRVVVEAMASGVVPVAHERGGYSEVIETGLNGVIYRDDDEALSWLARLREEQSLWNAIANAGRERVKALYSPEAKERLINFYTSG